MATFLSEGMPRETTMLSTRQKTSDDAYATARLSDNRRMVLGIVSAAPCTCDEIMARGFSHQTVSATINWLMREGLIVDSGMRRKTRSGRDAIVWRQERNPVPLKHSRPTRTQLQARIAKALLAISAGADKATIERVLRGESH